MTIREVKTAIHAMGLTCRYHAAYAEFRIDYLRSDVRWTTDSAYFTTDRSDAVATARRMAEWRKS